MSSRSASYMGPREVSYLFIDGAYLNRAVNNVAKNFFGEETIPIDFRKLASGYTKSFYYDCPRPQRNGELSEDYQNDIQRQKSFFNSIRCLDGYHVFEGTTTGDLGKPRQKQIDVKIAVDMLRHSHHRNMHKATLLTGDLDFKPLIDSLVDDGMYVTLWYEESSASRELIFSADAQRRLTITSVHGFSTNAFQAKFTIPQQRVMTKNLGGLTKQIKTGVSPSNLQVELHQGPDGFCVIFSYPDETTGQFLHIYHDDQGSLEKFVDSEFFKVKWLPGL